MTAVPCTGHRSGPPAARPDRKQADAPYRPGTRTGTWAKLKCVRARELVIGGWTDPQGSRTGFGALLVGYHDEAGRLRHPRYLGLRENKDPADVTREEPPR